MENFRLHKLTQDFYSDYPNKDYPEIAQKSGRPYIVFLVEIENNIFGIPFRTNITHDECYAFKNTGRITNSKTGLDFSKAVILNNKKYIGKATNIDDKEYIELRNKCYFIYKKFKRYCENYKKYVQQNNNILTIKYKYTTLQYFHKELGLK